ncbi:DUF1080 domain-containing protein [Bacteroidota bacterium]
MKNKIFTFFICGFFLIPNLFSQEAKLTEDWSKKPEVIKSKKKNKPPSDAIILFNGKNLSKWTGRDGIAKWKKRCRSMQTNSTGDIRTIQEFSDCQLHIEWRTPRKVKGDGQGRGNSGVFLMGKYEVQVLDSYENETYYNGQAGSIYKQHIPLVNASKKPGKWQSYDIIFTAPHFRDDGSLASAARITVLHNGVLIQNNVEIKGPTSYVGQPRYVPHKEKEALKLQDHGNPVRYRNIWIREL